MKSIRKLAYAVVGMFLPVTALYAAVPSQNNEVTSEVVVPDKDVVQKTDKLARQRLSQQDVDYLLTNTDEFEQLLSRLVLVGDAEGLATLLPVYERVPNRDESLIDWGNAIIAAKNGRLREAINLYRKINSALPDVKPLRFQMAIALYQDKQYAAAQSEFEKLRSEALSDEDKNVIDSFLNGIVSQDEWDINASVSYLYDNNLSNSPEQGTVLFFPNGSSITADRPLETGRGFSFNFSGDKKWRLQNNWFTALHLSTGGNIYLNNKKYNDLNARVGVGIGYANAYSEFELEPFYHNKWTVDSREADNNLDQNSKTFGLRFNAQQWINPQLRYQGALEFAKDKYVDRYNHLDGNRYLFSNTLLYFSNQRQYWFGGLDVIRRDVESKSDSYTRVGGRIGWGQEWGKGISTRTSLGYATKSFDEADFFGIKQKSNEYTANLSVWNRDWHIWGVTPRISFNYNKVDGNHPFYRYDTKNVYLDFTKTF